MYIIYLLATALAAIYYSCSCHFTCSGSLLIEITPGGWGHASPSTWTGSVVSTSILICENQSVVSFRLNLVKSVLLRTSLPWPSLIPLRIPLWICPYSNITSNRSHMIRNKSHMVSDTSHMISDTGHMIRNKSHMISNMSHMMVT